MISVSLESIKKYDGKHFRYGGKLYRVIDVVWEIEANTVVHKEKRDGRFNGYRHVATTDLSSKLKIRGLAVCKPYGLVALYESDFLVSYHQWHGFMQIIPNNIEPAAVLLNEKEATEFLKQQQVEVDAAMDSITPKTQTPRVPKRSPKRR